MTQAETVQIPKQLPLVTVPQNRGTSTSEDSKLVNCYSEKQEDGSYWIYKRGGLSVSSQPSGGAVVGRGMWNWKGNIYSIFGDKLYKDGVAVSGTVNTTNGIYRFDSCLGATPKLQLGDGVKGYNYDGVNGLVEINDVDFPSAFVKGWAYLDGTTYVMTAAAAIQGDDINTPTSWDPLNVLVAQIEPDGGVALAKQLVYVIALKEWTTEVFYDAGNATGSPLGSVQGAKVSYGCVKAESVATVDDILLWVSTNRSGAPQVIKLENLKGQIVSTDAIERLLGVWDFTTVYAFTIKNLGHRFYVVTSVVSNMTLVYDLDQDMWHQWTDTNGNYFPFLSSVSDSSLNTYLQHATDGRIYLFDEALLTDAGELITVDIVTPNFDGGTRRKKQMQNLTFIADQVPGSTLQVRHNDSDYAATKWTNFRSVDLGQKRPMLTYNGTFRRRAHHLRHRANTKFRIQAVELQLDLGTL